MKGIYSVFDEVIEKYRLQKKYLDDIEKLGEYYAHINEICYDLDIDDDKRRDYESFIAHVLMKLKSKIDKESRESIVVPVYNRHFTCEYIKENDNQYLYTYTSTDNDYKFTETVDHILDESELMNRLEYYIRKDQEEKNRRHKINDNTIEKHKVNTPYKSNNKRQVFTKDNVDMHVYKIKINDKEFVVKKYYDPQSKCYCYKAQHNSEKFHTTLEMISDKQLNDDEIAKWVGGVN